MRTQFNIDRLSGTNLITLPELSAALSQPDAMKLPPKSGTHMNTGATRATGKAQGRDASHETVIPAELLAAVQQTLDGALSGTFPDDPLLGPSLSCLTSAVNSVIKRSGSLIEKSIRAALERAGYIVFTQVAMQLTDAAKELVRSNARETLRGVNVKMAAPADNEPLVIYDMLVIHPGTRRATLIEVKRGGGSTELRKIEPISATLLAGSLQVASFLRAKGIKVRLVDACVIDFYGRSGFADHLRVSGEQIDARFKAPVKALVDAVLNEVRARLFEIVPDLIHEALVEARGDDAGDTVSDLVELPGGARLPRRHLPMIETPRKPMLATVA